MRAIDDEEESIAGCTQWGKKEFVFTVNIALHNIHDWVENFELLIHEMGHFREQSNAHCVTGFYEACNMMSAKLAQLALTQPRLFRGTSTSFLPEKFKVAPVDVEQIAASE